MKDKNKIAQIKADANKAKSELMTLIDQLYAVDAPKEAEQLEINFIKLEVWQNN